MDHPTASSHGEGSSTGEYGVPPSPNPSADQGLIPRMSSPTKTAPPPSAQAEYDVTDMEPITAMQLLARLVQSLANITGDVPPTPPISRPTTPSRHHHRRTSSRPATPVPSDDLKAPTFKDIELGSPEAQAHEAATGIIAPNAEPLYVQKIAIARKFFSKKAPPIDIEQYLMRLQRYCPMSTAVYLAAGAYIYKLAVEEKVVPVTNRTIHRLVLGTLRVAMKALEDLRYPQQRFAGVGGVSENELKMLEIAVCYLTDFDLQVTTSQMHEKMGLLQQAAEQGNAVKSALSPSFQPRLPIRRA